MEHGQPYAYGLECVGSCRPRGKAGETQGVFPRLVLSDRPKKPEPPQTSTPARAAELFGVSRPPAPPGTHRVGQFFVMIRASARRRPPEPSSSRRRPRLGRIA